MAPEATKQELRVRLRERELIAELGSFALRAESLDVLLHEACRLVAEGLGTSLCKILEYLPAEDAFLVRAGVGWKEGVVGHAKLESGTGSPAGYALQGGQPVISNKLSEETRFRTPRLILEHGVERAINVLIANGVPFGVLEADSRRPGAFSEDDVAFLQAAANLVGVAIERHRKEAALREAMEAQALLIREADHRIKNSLQLVASLLTLQRSRLSDPDAAQAIGDAIARVRAVAQAHRALHRSSDLRTLAFAQMLQDICSHVGQLNPAVAIECVAQEGLELDAERAIPLGLAVSELLTNALQHAYPEGQSGTVRVTAGIENGYLKLSVTDQGVGMKPDYEERTTLGATIVRSLVKQVGAELSVSTQPGQGSSAILRMRQQTDTDQG
ncbi:MAG: GAF domain-containing protein [Acetobacteraceae bacterium]|nr:GAF domain-containing protein [Acetobacteraceae bacterium]